MAVKSKFVSRKILEKRDGIFYEKVYFGDCKGYSGCAVLVKAALRLGPFRRAGRLPFLT
jgi:hypothetical protein